MRADDSDADVAPEADHDGNVLAERSALAQVVPRYLDSTGLRRTNAIDLDTLWASPDLGAAWAEDERLIQSLDLPEMTGGVNPGDQRALYYLVLGLRCRTVLEVGTHIGCSMVNIAAALKRLSTNGTSARLTCVDINDVNDESKRPWEAFGAKRSPRSLLQSLEAEQLVEFVIADSLDHLRSDRARYDLIFLDGLHDAARVYQEVPYAATRLNGGVIVLHDFFPNLKPLWSNGSMIPGPFLGVERLRAEWHSIEAIPLRALPWPTKLGSHVTSLAVLGGSGEDDTKDRG